MPSIQTWLSLLRFSRGISAYAAGLLCAAIMLALALHMLQGAVVGDASYSPADVFLGALGLLVLIVPAVWLTTFVLAYVPVLLAAGLNRLLRSRRMVSDRARHGIIYAIAISLSLPMAAVAWSVSFDGWTWFWPLMIIVAAAGACRELIAQAENEVKQQLV
jgi:hypothetical protein